MDNPETQGTLHKRHRMKTHTKKQQDIKLKRWTTLTSPKGLNPSAREGYTLLVSY
jgi:hypothetical protein